MNDRHTTESPRYRISPPGTEWVCPACARHWSGDRYDGKDTSCVTWAVLCISPPATDEAGKPTWTAVGEVKRVETTVRVSL